MIGGIIDAVIGAATNKRDYDRQVSQFNQQYELQKDQFYRPMQYRVADLKKAGLHPTLAAGMTSGQVVSNAPSSLPQQPNTNIAGALQSKALSNELIQAQIENIKAQTEDIRANTPIKGQSSSIHDAQAAGTKKIIEQPPVIVTKNQKIKPQHWKSGLKGHIFTLPNGKSWTVGEAVPAEIVEQEYGEAGGLLYGAWKLYADTRSNSRDSRQKPGFVRAPNGRYYRVYPKRMKGKAEQKRYKQWQKTPSDIPNW